LANRSEMQRKNSIWKVGRGQLVWARFCGTDSCVQLIASSRRQPPHRSMRHEMPLTPRFPVCVFGDVAWTVARSVRWSPSFCRDSRRASSATSFRSSVPVCVAMKRFSTDRAETMSMHSDRQLRSDCVEARSTRPRIAGRGSDASERPRDVMSPVEDREQKAARDAVVRVRMVQKVAESTAETSPICSRRVLSVSERAA